MKYSRLNDVEKARIRVILQAEERPTLEVIARRFNCHLRVIMKIQKEIRDAKEQDIHQATEGN